MTVGYVTVGLQTTGGSRFAQAFDAAAKKVNIFTKNANDGAEKASGGMGRLEGAFSGAIAKIGALTASLIGLHEAFNFGKEVLELGSRFNETGNVISQVFGKSAGDVEAWAQSTGQALGRSQQQMRDYAGQLGSLISPMVGNSAETLQMSKGFSQLAVDIGSFNNVADDDVMMALKSAISGEAEPMKKFGVVMSDATLEAYRLAEGIKVKYSAMDLASKTALRYNFILDHTTRQQGDAAATADGYANTLKSAEAVIQNVGTKIGQDMIPPMTELVQTFIDMAKVIGESDWKEFGINLAAGLKTIADVALTVTSAVLELVTAIRKYAAIALALSGRSEAVQSLAKFIAPDEADAKNTQEMIKNLQLKLAGEPYHFENGKMIWDQPIDAGAVPPGYHREGSPRTKLKGLKHTYKADAGKLDAAEAESYNKGFVGWDDAMKQSFEDAKNAGDAIRDIESYFEEVAKHTAEFEEGLKATLYDSSKGFKENMNKAFTDVTSVDWTQAFVGMFSEGGQKAMGDFLSGGVGSDMANQAMGLFKQVVPAFDMSSEEVNKIAGVLKQGGAALKGGLNVAMQAVGMIGEAIQSFINAVLEMVKALAGVFKATGGRVLEDMFKESRLKGGFDAAGGVFAAVGGLFAAKLGEFMIPLIPLFLGLAASMAAFDLSTQTQSFKRYQDAMGGAMDLMVKQLEPFWRMLMPVAGLFAAMAVSVGQFLLMILPGPVLMHMLFDAMKMLGIIILNIIVSFENLHVVILDMLANLALTRDDRQRFRTERDIAAGNRHNTEGAINTLTNMSFTEGADLANQMADAFNAKDGGSTASDYGVPSGYKSGSQAWKAMDPTGAAQDQADAQEEGNGILQHIADMLEDFRQGRTVQGPAGVGSSQQNMATTGTRGTLASRYGG